MKKASVRLSTLFLIAALAGCATAPPVPSAEPLKKGGSEPRDPVSTLLSPVPSGEVEQPPVRGRVDPDAKVVKVFVRKADRLLELLDVRGETIKSYRISLGFNPREDKVCQGDGRTPEGDYTIVRHNPKSRYFLSLKISYPSSADRREAVQRCRSEKAGGDIFIHGKPNYAGPDDTRHSLQRDWTHGCIALPNKDIQEIYRRVPDGTPIMIVP